MSAHPQSPEARQLLTRVQQDLAAEETEKARRCERCLDRARRALQLEQLEEAERQLQLAVETGAVHDDIARYAALGEARRRHSATVVQRSPELAAPALIRKAPAARRSAAEASPPGLRHTVATAELSRCGEEPRLEAAQRALRESTAREVAALALASTTPLRRRDSRRSAQAGADHELA